MGRSTMLAIIGVSVGAVMAYAAGRSMQALLFGVNPADLPSSPPRSVCRC